VFTHFINDTVSILKSNGDLYENVQASVQKNIILITDVSLPIEKGDKIIRVLPSKVKEVFIVEEPGYHSQIHNIQAHYQIRYSKGFDTNTTQPQQVIYHVQGDNARVNIHSSDSSINIIQNNSSELFDKLVAFIKDQVADEKDRNALIAKTEEMRQAHGTSGFLSKYQEFMTLAANHATVLAPFMPALAGLLSRPSAVISLLARNEQMPQDKQAEQKRKL
jgi:hypothetical protein